jgi:hypothetical protein
LLNDDGLVHLGGGPVDNVEHLCIFFVGLFLKLLVCVYLVAFGLQDPAEGFGVHVVYIVLA